MIKRSSRRLSAVVTAALALAAAAAATGAPGSPVLTAQQRAAAVGGVILSGPAGSVRGGEHEAVRPIDTAVADSDTVANYLKYTSQAAKLPVANGSLKWKLNGPYGITMPPSYSQSGERFERVAGMGTSVVVDPTDGSGNTVYMGNMGGLWRSKDAGSHWTNLTDGKLPRVAIGAIGLDRQHPSDIYVATGSSFFTLSGDTPGTGIYYSHDKGKTFHRSSGPVKGYGGNAVLTSPSGVLVGTNHGLYSSTDRGASFRPISLPTNATHSGPAKGPYANWVTAIAGEPTHPAEITVAIGFALGKKLLPDGTVASPGNGLYRSTNGVKGPFKFLSGSTGLTNPEASSDPIGRISLSYGGVSGQNHVLWALVHDAGLTAKKQPGGLDVVGSTTGKNLNATNTLLNGIYRSDDDGRTWTVKGTPTSILGAPNSTVATIAALGYSPGVQAYYNNWVLADPIVPDRVYFGLEEVYQSSANTGSNPGLGQFTVIQRYADTCGFLTYFQNVTNGLACPTQTPLYGGESTHPDQHTAAIAVLPGGKHTRLYTGNDGGFFREDSHTISDQSEGYDNSSWTDMNDLTTLEPYHAVRMPDGEILGAFQDNGSAILDNHGVGITISGGDGVYVFATKNPDVFYSSSQGAALYVTHDHGHNITEIQPSLVNPGFMSPIAIDPTDPNHLVAAAEDFEESLKGPETVVVSDPVAGNILQTDWTTSFDAGNSPAIVAGKAVPWGATAIGVRGAVSYYVACGTCRGSTTDPKLMNNGVFTNSKAGCTPAKAKAACWHKAKGVGLPKAQISQMVIDPRNTATIYLAVAESNVIGYDQKVAGAARVLVSHDRGDHFTDITGNLPRTNTRSIVIRDDKLIVGGDVGIFTAGLGGKSWKRLGGSIPQVRVYDLSLDSTGRYLTASLYGRGIWTLDFGKSARSSAGAGLAGEPFVPSSHGLGGALHAAMTARGLATWALILLTGASFVRTVRRWRAPATAAAV